MSKINKELKKQINWFNNTYNEPYIFSFTNNNGKPEVEMNGIKEQMMVQLACIMEKNEEVFEFLKGAVSLVEIKKEMENEMIKNFYSKNSYCKN